MTNRQTSGRVAFFLPSLEGGGAERVMVNLCIGLAQRGFQMDLVLASASGPFLAEVPPNVRLIELKGSVLRSLPALARYLHREKPVVLLTALNHANLVAMAAARASFARTRVVIAIHSILTNEIAEASCARTRAIPWLLGHLHWLADGIVAVSESVAIDFARHAGIDPGRISVIPNPVITPTVLAATSATPAHPWFAEPIPIVLGVGRLVPSKRFLDLIDAFAAVVRTQPARLVLLGEGPERPALEARVQKLGLTDRVALPGFVDNPYPYMAKASVMALSSEFEGLPTVVIESLAVGTPVVSTDCPGGSREILRNGALGALVPIGDVAALAQAVGAALEGGRITPPWTALESYMPTTVLGRYQHVLGLHAEAC